jgi:hypothetical protein
LAVLADNVLEVEIRLDQVYGPADLELLDLLQEARACLGEDAEERGDRRRERGEILLVGGDVGICQPRRALPVLVAAWLADHPRDHVGPEEPLGLADDLGLEDLLMEKVERHAVVGAEIIAVEPRLDELLEPLVANRAVEHKLGARAVKVDRRDDGREERRARNKVCGSPWDGQWARSNMPRAEHVAQKQTKVSVADNFSPARRTDPFAEVENAPAVRTSI